MKINKTIFILVVLSIMLPLYMYGYVLSFDLVWGPVTKKTQYGDNTVVLLNFMKNFTLINSQIFEKIILTAIVSLSIFGIYNLLKTIIKVNKSNRTILAIVSILYVFNPFFYTRFITGQWLVSFGYALLPWAVRSIYLFVIKPSWRSAWPVAAWTAAIGLTSIHTIGIVAVAGIGLLIYSGRSMWQVKVRYSAVIAVLWLIANALWIVPFVTGDSAVSRDVASFSMSQMQAFATQGTVAGSVPLSAALLTGFWADDQNRYILPSSLPIWYIGVVLVATLVIAGVVRVVRRRDKLGYTFIGLGITAWILAMGIAWPPSAVITNALIHIFPYYNGYREPQKWLMLLALVYVYVAALGADSFYRRIATKYKADAVRYGFVTLLIVTPFLYAPTLAWGAAGQLKSSDYPTGWYEAKNYLNTQTKNSKSIQVAVFPWHMYLPIRFTGRVVANPTGYFFEQTMITGDNFELQGVPPQGQTPTTAYISNTLLPNTTSHVAVGKKLSDHHIDYVLLLKEADWKRYSWLDQQSDLKLVVDNASLKLYKTEAK